MGNLKCISLPKIWRFIASFLLLLCCSQGANAVDYKWRLSGDGENWYPNRDAACTHALSYSAGRGVTAEIEMIGSVYRCYVKNGAAEVVLYFDLEWQGTGCTAPKVENPANGGCDTPQEDKCKSTFGQTVNHSQKLADIVNGKFSNYKEPPATVCAGSCEYNSPATSTDAYRFRSGDPAGVWQDYTYLGTGKSCTADANSPEPTKVSDRSPISAKNNECTNKVTDAEGRVHYSCLATDGFTEPGNLKCGTVNGELKCSTGSPSPKQKTTETKTEVTESQASDGSSTTSTTTTTTVTNCTGVNSCTSTTTVTNSSSKTNADGSDGGSSSDCKGAGCKDGASDSDDEEDEEEEKKEVSGDGECKVSLSCSGDAIQCAILRQEKQQKCADEDFRTIDDKKVSDTQAGIESAFSGDEYSPIKPTQDGIFDLSSTIDTGHRFSSACPAVPDISFEWLDGATHTVAISELINQLCQVLTWIGYFVVAFAWRAAAEIVAKGIS